jgi:hypothetical protein
MSARNPSLPPPLERRVRKPAAAVPVWPRRAPVLSYPAASMHTRHVGRGPRFVDENERGKIKVQLIIEAASALLQDVGEALLYPTG